VPFVVHAGEGTDAAAAAEIDRLDTAGCLKATTVLVHGVAMTSGVWTRLLERGASLIWCPHSNQTLFGRTIPARAFLDVSPVARWRLCLGSDSRLTGARDLLDELRAARASANVSADELLTMVTVAAATVLRVTGAGRLVAGAAADVIVVPAVRDSAAESLLDTTRSGLECVAIDGRPVVCHPRFAPMFRARRMAQASLRIDGVPRLAPQALARRIRNCGIREEGVECC
jgi:cytosine/adenosine deaminase-related metal-dependent hydrolase